MIGGDGFRRWNMNANASALLPVPERLKTGAEGRSGRMKPRRAETSLPRGHYVSIVPKTPPPETFGLMRIDRCRERHMKIIINGAGIAGPTLAWWLLHYGFEPILVEEAPTLRKGGYVVDFWGVGYDIAEKMNLLPVILDAGYRMQELRLVGEHGQRVGGFSGDVMQALTDGRYISLARSDLSAAIYRQIEGKVETIFSDSIAGIEPRENGARVTFERSGPRDCDLVIGADGLHSAVRRLVFGPQDEFERHLGYEVAAFEMRGYRPRDELVYVSYSEPGKQAARFALKNDRTLFLFVFRDELSDRPAPHDDQARRAALRQVFANSEWECRKILAAMDQVEHIYFDRVSQIRMNRWSEGRVALVGDAAYCPSLLAGEGSGLAMSGAYILAGELEKAGGDYKAAFAHYEQLMRPFIEEKQTAAAGFASSFAPKTALGVYLRNLATRAMAIPFVARLLMGRVIRDDISMPDYAA
jgi:2-polyprenyl-6-methoxyphenol hydroxylase-like FAD-dependent oxidoreductase